MNDPRSPEEIIECQKLADEFAVLGTVKHFAMRLGFMPFDEAAAETILKNIVNEWGQKF